MFPTNPVNGQRYNDYVYKNGLWKYNPYTILKQDNTEGGEIRLELDSNSSLTGPNIVIDTVGDSVRIFDQGGDNNGLTIPLTKLAAGTASGAGYNYIDNANGQCIEFTNGLKIQMFNYTSNDLITETGNHVIWTYPVAFTTAVYTSNCIGRFSYADYFTYSTQGITLTSLYGYWRPSGNDLASNAANNTTDVSLMAIGI